jgi:hypothetical protein
MSKDADGNILIGTFYPKIGHVEQKGKSILQGHFANA